MKKKILIIEDDIVIMETTAEFLNEEGFEVYTAVNGVEGIQKAIEIIPDLIISDVSMPLKNGYEVCKTLQSVPDTNTIPFIFLTARIQKDDVRHGMQLGADDYLAKPFDYSELLKSIRIRLEKHDRSINQSDERFYALIDNPMVGVYIYEGNKFLYSNSIISEISGYSRDELKLMSFEDLTYTENNDAALEEIQRCLKEIKSSVRIELKILKKDQSQTLIDIFGTLIKFRKKDCLMGNIIEKNSEPIIGKNTGKSVLSDREIEVLQLICKGFSSAEIAEKIFLSQRTIDAHRANLITKTESSNTAGLVMYAIRNHLVEL
ncbi:MAG: response regulator [Bacteroidales bacterium]|nr:response regulator [Bacteroidales bacterium]